MNENLNENLLIEIQAGNAILSAPTTGKTTLREAHSDLDWVDQDQVKIQLNGQVNPFPQHCRAKMWMILAAVLAEGGVVTYSDFDREADKTADAQYVKERTVLACYRDNAEMKQIMEKRDGHAHPDCMKWSFDWYKDITKVVIKLPKGAFLQTYLSIHTDQIAKHT